MFVCHRVSVRCRRSVLSSASSGSLDVSVSSPASRVFLSVAVGLQAA